MKRARLVAANKATLGMVYTTGHIILDPGYMLYPSFGGLLFADCALFPFLRAVLNRPKMGGASAFA